ncbi:hypothetical protein [Ornithinibacillus hominis]|uniref:Uncharacterized protein n=1 Tax=Ornithinibacillus hominis TaxID=2763055 RepID=A0A923RH32_9BACI|nr:hypothetical protein [Ornithinibacillus hominis]MBC5636349.1 hypothetical protein [Ornithinibacillus hominis]
MSFDTLRNKIAQLNNQTQAFTTELYELVKDYKSKPNINSILGFFTYSVNMTSDPKEENIILGDFHIHNLTGNTLAALYLCLKVNTTSTYKFTGKYLTKSAQADSSEPFSYWQQLPERNEEHEYWFQLTPNKEVKPLEKIAFSDFQVSWKNTRSNVCSIQAFLYTESEKEGINSLNSISVNTTG